MRKGFFVKLVSGAMLAAAAVSASAQSYPSRPIRIIVAVTPGGGNDVFARILAPKLQERLGQPVIVENKPGAGMSIGAEYVARSAADGYTVLVMTNAMAAMMPSLLANPLPFDMIKDFAPIGIAVSQPVVLALANKVPANSLGELIAYAKANPGKLFYGTPGLGTLHHLVSEWFLDMTGTKMVHVPYNKGAAPLLAALISGEVGVMFGALNSAAPLIQSGKIRAIAVGGRQRVAQFKALPTIGESLPGYEVSFWYGLLAPAGTPGAITNKLSEEQRSIVNLSDVRERFAGIGFESTPSSPAEMRQIMVAEIGKWAKVIKAAGIQPQ